MTGSAGLLTPGSGRDAALPVSCQKGRSAGSLALATKEPLLELGHLGFQHAHLCFQFLGPCHRTPMLATVVMGLLT
jgi:hypothetical protein